jgi:hypothetical protein
MTEASGVDWRKLCGASCLADGARSAVVDEVKGAGRGREGGPGGRRKEGGGGREVKGAEMRRESRRVSRKSR